MMILLCELALKSEGIRFRLLWTIKELSSCYHFLKFFSLSTNLTFRPQTPSSGPVFSTGAMGRIPITLS